MIRWMHSLFVVLLGTGISWACIGATKSYLERGKFMSLQDARKRWGEKPFSPEAFKAASTKDRAAMTFDLINRKQMVGKTSKEIKELLGATSGYFWSEKVPTYFIEEGWKEKKDSWQLVFLIDENEKVAEIRIHKNCCE